MKNNNFQHDNLDRQFNNTRSRQKERDGYWKGELLITTNKEKISIYSESPVKYTL